MVLPLMTTVLIMLAFNVLNETYACDTGNGEGYYSFYIMFYFNAVIFTLTYLVVVYIPFKLRFVILVND